MFSALRRHALCCEKVLFCWSGWNAEGLLCTCEAQQHDRPELHSLCSLAPESDPDFSAL